MTDVPVMFTVTQICRIMNLSRSKVYAMVQTGEIPSGRMSRAGGPPCPHGELLIGDEVASGKGNPVQLVSP